METGKDKYDYVIKMDQDVLDRTKDFREGLEEERIKENMRRDIEWLDKNKHLLYDKNYFKTRVLISVGGWKYFFTLWKIIAYLILAGLSVGWALL